MQASHPEINAVTVVSRQPGRAPSDCVHADQELDNAEEQMIVVHPQKEAAVIADGLRINWAFRGGR